MIDFLVWLEETRFSTWMRESGPAFFSSLVFHSIGMAFVAGVHVATDLRILGVAPCIPLSRTCASWAWPGESRWKRCTGWCLGVSEAIS